MSEPLTEKLMGLNQLWNFTELVPYDHVFWGSLDRPVFKKKKMTFYMLSFKFTI